MATSHLKGYNEYDLLLLITYVINQYNTDVAASVPIISPYDNLQPQKTNYYFLSNILRISDKFWKEERENGIEIKGNELIQIPG